MRHKLLLPALILSAVITIPSAFNNCAAEPAIEQNGPMLGVFFSSELALDQQQKSAVREILKRNRALTSEDFFAFRDAQTALRDYLRSGGSEPGQIEKLTTTCGTALQKLQMGEAAAFSEAYQYLSDAQKKTLASIKDAHVMPK